MVDESCAATDSNLSSLCELAGKLSVRLGAVMSNSAQLCHVIVSLLHHTLAVDLMDLAYY